METVTVFKKSYDTDQADLMRYSHELYHLRGTVIALADIIKSNPEYVESKLEELAQEFQKV